MTNQGIVYAGWNPDWFKFFLGALLLGAILLNVVRPQTGGGNAMTDSHSGCAAASGSATSARTTATSSRCRASTWRSARAR